MKQVQINFLEYLKRGGATDQEIDDIMESVPETRMNEILTFNLESEDESN